MSRLQHPGSCPIPVQRGGSCWPRVVVTGATGFIGSHLVDALLAAGYVVAGVNRRNPGSELSTARRRFLRLWHQHETPSGVWGRDRRDRNHRAAGYHTITTLTIRRRERRRRAKATVSIVTAPCNASRPTDTP